MSRRYEVVLRRLGRWWAVDVPGLSLHSQCRTPARCWALPPPALRPPRLPDLPCRVPQGAGYVRGTLTWYNRSVAFDGTLRAVGCRRPWFGAYCASGNELSARSTSTKCDLTYPISVGIPADAPGGAAYVIVCVDDANANPLKCERYNRP